MSVIKHVIITEGVDHPAANESDGVLNLLVAVQYLGRSIIIRRHRDAVERRPFTPELPTDFIKGVLVEKMGLPVPVQIRVLSGQINHQNGQYTEIAGDQRIDNLLAEQDTGNQHRVVTQHAHLQAEVRLLPAQEDAQQGHGDVKIGAEVNNRIQMAVIVSFIRCEVENRSRPGGGKDENHRNCRRDIGQGSQIFSQGRIPVAFFRRVIVQRPAPEYKTEEVTLVDNIHQPQGILRPDFVHFTGNQVEGRHGQIGQHDPQKTVAGANGQVPSGTVKY